VSIRETPSNGTTYEPHCRCQTEHEPDLLGIEPASRKKGRQEGREKSERTEQCAVEDHKSKQCAVLDGQWICRSRAALQVLSL